MEEQESLQHFLRLIATKRYVDAHEALEPLWKHAKTNPETQERALALKGFINGATALALREMGRIDGANRVWLNYLKYKGNQNPTCDAAIIEALEGAWNQ